MFKLVKHRVEALPLDLHVLGTPPAFILSQDQTLQKESDILRFHLKPKLKELTLINCTTQFLMIIIVWHSNRDPTKTELHPTLLSL
jgi:hypothetical protein